MTTKTLTPSALSTIEQYLHFKIGPATCSVPYFNNKTTLARAGLRVNGGKGSPKDLYDEVHDLLIKSHVTTDSLTTESLKKILTDQNLGIDCSGFAYYVLDAEFRELKKGPLAQHITFINAHGILGKIRAKLRPVENCDVATLAHNENSSSVAVKDILPGDIITMTAYDNVDMSNQPISRETERDHVLVIHQVEYQDLSPIKIHYSHAVAYPEDGVYGTGIKQGIIEITDPTKPITESIWTENGTVGDSNRIFVRAKKSNTAVRRFK